MIVPRSFQREFSIGCDQSRVCGLVARRQIGKTRGSARWALKRMMKVAGHTVNFASVKLDLGRDMTMHEAKEMAEAIQWLREAGAQGQTTLNDDTGRVLNGLRIDDFTELYEHSKLEFRFYHSRTLYSRTKIVSMSPSSVGETGDLVLDEVARGRDFAAVYEAMMPIVSSNPAFRVLITTTPPPDDTHLSFSLLAPPMGQEFAVNPRGNWYRSAMGIRVLRVTAWDAAADGIPLYSDDTGAILTPDEHRALAHDKFAWDRNYGCCFLVGGTAAVGMLVLDEAQRRGVGTCRLFEIEDETTMANACAWIASRVSGTFGAGLDLATTTSDTSNPTAFAIALPDGDSVRVPFLAVWKTAEPGITESRVKRLIQAAQGAGSRCRRLSIDASNERFFSTQLRHAMSGICGCDLIIASATATRLAINSGEPMNEKQFLGSRLVTLIDDRKLVLPPEKYLYEDFRLVKRDKGNFACSPDGRGRHGDTFDAVKLALRSITAPETSELSVAVRPRVV